VKVDSARMTTRWINCIDGASGLQSIEIDCNQSSWLAQEGRNKASALLSKEQASKRTAPESIASEMAVWKCMPIQPTPIIAATMSTFAHRKRTYIAQFSTLHMECKKVEKVDGLKRHGALL